MRMGNLLHVAIQPSSVMAASKPRLGVAHPTVVPGESRSESDDEAPAERAELEEADDEADSERDA